MITEVLSYLLSSLPVVMNYKGILICLVVVVVVIQAMPSDYKLKDRRFSFDDLVSTHVEQTK